MRSFTMRWPALRDVLTAYGLAGLANYAELWADPIFRRSFTNTLLYVAVVMPASVALGFGVALLIQVGTGGRTFFRTAYFLPVASTFVAMATVWQFMLHPNLGIVSEILGILGLSAPIGSPTGAWSS